MSSNRPGLEHYAFRFLQAAVSNVCASQESNLFFSPNIAMLKQGFDSACNAAINDHSFEVALNCLLKGVKNPPDINT
jgi:hypothetical protein